LKGNELLLPGKDLKDFLQAILAKGTPCRFQAKGYSMSPFIRDGDIITVFPLKKSSFDLGRVVAYSQPETQKLIVHRIIGNSSGYFLIRGDNIFGPGELVPKTNVLGHVGRIERYGRRVFIGVGPERFLIVLLIRLKIIRLLRPLSKIILPFLKRITS